MTPEIIELLTNTARGAAKHYKGLTFDDALHAGIECYLTQPSDTPEKLKVSRCYWAIRRAGLLTRYSSLSEYYSIRSATLKAQGKCTICTKPADGSYCSECKAKRKKNRVAQQQRDKRLRHDRQRTEKATQSR